MNEMWSLRSTGPCQWVGGLTEVREPSAKLCVTQFFLFPLYKELETNSCCQEWKTRWKHSFIFSFPPPSMLFSVTVYPDEDDDRRGWAEKTAGPQQRRALGSIASLSCQHWPATIMHTQRLYPPGLFQHRNKT